MQTNEQKYNTITKENINVMVMKFYTRILNENTDVSKVFKSRLGEDINSSMWQEHTELLTNFWAMIALQDTHYQGNPMMAHLNMGLTKDMFPIWLKIFFETIDSLYDEEQGYIFKSRAENIAMNFIRNLRL